MTRTYCDCCREEIVNYRMQCRVTVDGVSSGAPYEAYVLCPTCVAKLRRLIARDLPEWCGMPCRTDSDT